MTILPKRNKRRYEQRDEAVQQIPQTVSNASMDGNSANHSAQLQIQIQPEASRPHSHNLAHLQSGHTSHSTHQPGHTRHSQASVYNLLQRAEGNHSKTPLVASSEAGKWRNTSVTLATRSSAEDGGHIPNKKSKRSKLKQKHKLDSHSAKDNHDFAHSHNGSTSKASASVNSFTHYLQNNFHSTSAGSALSQSSRALSVTAAVSVPGQIITPHMIVSSADAAAKASPSRSSEHAVNSEDEYQTAPSPGGCNSEDEYMPSGQLYSEDLEKTFEIALKKELGLDIKQTEMDGSCLFRAVADQVFGDQEMHDVVRTNCIDYMAKNADHFSHYVTENFNTYLDRKRQLGCHGNHIELQALSEMYNRPIEVYQYSLKPMNIFHSNRSESTCPIRLTYHRNTHYNSLVDPSRPTIGVGLGLPGLRPRMVEQSIVSDVKTQSEGYQLEQAMLDDKLRETDWELTDDAIQEQVARESYIQWLEDQKRHRRPPACTVTGPSCSSGTQAPAASCGTPQHSPYHQHSPKTSGQHSPKLALSLIGASATTAPSASQTSPRSPAARKTRSSGGGSSPVLPLVTAATSSQSTVTDCELGAAAAVDHMTSATSLPDVAGVTYGSSVFSYNGDMDEAEAIARAIAESQQDYINEVIQRKS